MNERKGGTSVRRDYNHAEVDRRTRADKGIVPRLIAAAPELLDALEQLTDLVNIAGIGDSPERRAYDRARAAIRKATGRGV